MFRNYLAAALRNLVRNRLYAAINIVGLAVGLTGALLIALFIRDEYSYESWIPGYQRTFIVRGEFRGQFGSIIFDDSLAQFADWMKSDLTSVENVARLSKLPMAQPPIADIRHGDVEGNERLYWADPGIFSVLPLPVLAGDLMTALEKPDGVVLTRRMARKYFGRDDPVGETLEIDRQHTMTVAAVLQDLPSNTHLNFDFLASGRAAFSDLTKLDQQPPDAGVFDAEVFTYLRLKPKATIAELRSAMPALFDRHGITTKVAQMADVGAKISFPLLPITDIYLSMSTPSWPMKPRGNASTSYALGIVAVLLVLIAGINFVSLMTARATRRAVEVGIRKVSGATRRHLALQFIGESVMYVAIGLLLAGALVNALVPRFNAYLQRDSITFDVGRNAPLAFALVGAALLIGALAGIYPAVVLPSFNVAVVLKSGRIKNVGSAGVRQGLVVIQFAVLIGLLLAALIVYRQTSFAFNESMRLKTAQMLLVRTNCTTPFKDEVRQLPGVSGAACSSEMALNYQRIAASISRADKPPVVLDMGVVDFGFFELYGLRPLAGRFFDPSQGIDTGETASSMILNETAVRKFGFKSNQGAIGQTMTLPDFQPMTSPYHPGVYRIVGVVPDFAVDAVHEQINPMAYFTFPGGSETSHQFLSVKLTGHDIPETLAAIDRLWAKAGEPKAIMRTFLDQRVQDLYLDITRQSQLFGAFSGLAVFVACLGLFGLAAYVAEQRTKEIGVRKALGASKADILCLMVWDFTKPVLWANAIAWPGGYFVMRRWLEGFAYHVNLSPWEFLAASGVSAMIAVLTVSGHALLIARTEPVTALRYE